jgi:hypothetical protein
VRCRLIAKADSAPKGAQDNTPAGRE